MGGTFPSQCYLLRRVNSRHISIFIISFADFKVSCLLLTEMGKRHQEADTDCKALGVPRGSNIHLGKEEGGGYKQNSIHLFAVVMMSLAVTLNICSVLTTAFTTAV